MGGAHRLCDPATCETTRAGVFIAGTVRGGQQTSRWFIENGRFRARQIVAHLTGARGPVMTETSGQWKTEERLRHSLSPASLLSGGRRSDSSLRFPCKLTRRASHGDP